MSKNIMQRDNLVSVIVPIYNVETYLCRCIESIVAQTHDNLQIILVDDGSTDGSASICDEYHNKDNRIEVIHKENGGLVSARKAGLAVAQGKYIGFVDGDDYIDAEFYAIAVSDIVEYDVDFVHMALIKEYTAKSEQAVLYKCGVYQIGKRQTDFIKEYMLNMNGIYYMDYGLVCKLFKADLIKSCYADVPDSQSFGEDLLAVCRCLLCSKKIYLDTHAMYHYIIRETSISHLQNFESLINQSSLYSHLLRAFEDYGVAEEIRKELQYFFQNRFIAYLANRSKNRDIHVYRFPDISIGRIRGKKIVIYGAGKVGQDFYAQLCRYGDIQILAWTDKNSMAYKFDYAEIMKREEAAELKADYFIIAVLKAEKAQEIEAELIHMGVNAEKIIWEKPERCNTL